MIFVETSSFTKHRAAYLGDDEFRRLQSWLLFAPETGDVIPGSGGARKMRWGTVGRGKRGGLRIVYVYFPKAQRIYLLTLYGKGEASDLTHTQLVAIRQIIQFIRHELKEKHRSRDH